MEPEEGDVPNELEFYSKFTRTLIFNLLDAKDRVLASSWVKKIKDEASGTVKLRTDYLKLLLFALQRGHLVGVFADDPATYETLQEFPAECDLNDIAKKIIEKDQGSRQEKIKKQLRGEIGDHPPYITDCSSDFREYVAAQDIPNFGVHCYYAVSKEPVNMWQRSERGVFPKLARSAVDTTSPLPPCPEEGAATGGKSTTLCVCPPEEGQEESPCKTRMDATLAGPAEEKKKKRGKKWGQTPPTKPLGAIPPADERTPPTWGTNLLDVRESAVNLDDEEEPVGMGLVEDLSAVEQFVEDFRRGAIGTSKRAESTALQKTIEAANAGAEEKSVRREEEAEEEDEAAAQRAQEIEEDAHLVEYFKGQLTQAITKQTVSKDKQAAKTAIPAKRGIPVTTPKQAPIPKRPSPPKPDKSDPSFNVDDLDDDELADLGLTREEAKRMFSTDLFQMPLDEDSGAEDVSGAESSDEEPQRQAIDDEFDAWCERIKELEKECEADEFDAWSERIKEMEKECEADIRYIKAQGIDYDAIDISEEEGAAAEGPCTPVCPAKSPSPKKPPPKPKPPEKKPKGKGKSMIQRPGTLRPPAPKVALSPPKPAASRLQKPSVSKLKKPGEPTRQTPSESKLQQPSARPSKLQAPKAGRIPQAKRPCPPIQKGSPQAAAIIADFEKLSQLQISDEGALDLPQAEDADLLDDQQMPEEFGELDFVPPSPTEERFAQLDQYSQLVDSIMDVCEPCESFESPPGSPGMPSPRSPELYGLPALVSLPPPRTPSPVRTPRPQPIPQRAPSPRRSPSPSRVPAGTPPRSPRAASPPIEYPSPLKPISPPRRPSPPCAASLSPDITKLAAQMSPDRMSPAGIFGGPPCMSPDRMSPSGIIATSPDWPASPPPYEPGSPGDLFAQICGEGLDTSPPYIVDHYTTPPHSPGTPPMQRDRSEVGYSIGTPQVTPLSPKYADYKSPPKKVIKTDRKQIQRMEEKYLQFLFGDDQELHETLKRAASMVSDIEQDEPDPYHLMPPSPPTPPFPYDQLADGGIFAETFPEEFGSMSPPSPIPTQGGFLCPPGVAETTKTSTPVMSQLPLPGRGLLKPGFAAPSPRTPAGRDIPSVPCNAPCPKGKPAPSTGAPPGTPIIKPGKTPPCWTGLPVPAGGPVKKRSIPQPGARRGIPQPQLGPKSSGIAKPGGRYKLQIPESARPSPVPCGAGAQAPATGAHRASGIRPPAAGRGRPQRPQQSVSRPQQYFPQQSLDMEPQYPPMNIGFREGIKKHRFDEEFFDRQRPLQSSRCVVAGKTSGRRVVMQRVSDPRVRQPKPAMKLPLDFPKGIHPIRERADEPPLSPVQYGVPGIVPPPALQGPAGPCSGRAAGRGRPSGIKPPTASRIPPPSGIRPPSAGRGSQLRPPGSGIPSQLRPPGSGTPSQLRPPSQIRTPCGTPQPSGAQSPAEQMDLFELAGQIVGILGTYMEMKSKTESRFEELERSLTSGPTTPCGAPPSGQRASPPPPPAGAPPAGRQVGKGFKPGPGKKVQYPRQVPCTPPPPSPVPYWEVETPSPTFVPPPRPASPPREYSGFLGSPQAGPSSGPCGPPQYSPPAYDSPGEGLMEEAPPDMLDLPEDLRFPGIKSPPKMKQLAPCICPSEGIRSTPTMGRVPGAAPRPKGASRVTSNVGKRKLDFQILTPKDLDICDDYIASLEERYEDSLPPLPPEEEEPCGPCGPDIVVTEWRTPPEIERMVPKRKSPSPKPLTPVRTRPCIDSTPLPTSDQRSLFMESPELADSPEGYSPTPPRRTPPRRSPSPRSPSPRSPSPRSPSPRSPPSLQGSPVFSPCMSPGPDTGSRAEDIFSSAGVTFPTPSPPSPLSSRAAIEGMIAQVQKAPGRKGIERRRLRFDSPSISSLTPLPPIREMITRPGETRLGLPEVVQIDYDTIGSGMVEEEECVCGPYIPPSRTPRQESLLEEEYEEDGYEEDGYEDIYRDPGPMTEEERRQLQEVAPTSPLRPFQPVTLTSPPRPPPCSPPFALPGTTPMLDQESLSFEEDECFCADDAPQVTPKPSPVLSPCRSPPRTPTSPFLPQVSQYDPMISDQRMELYDSPGSPTAVDEYGLPSLVELYAKNMGPIYASPTQQRQRPIIRWEDRPYSPAPCAASNRFQTSNIQLDAITPPQSPVDVDVPISPLPPYVERELSAFHYSPPFPQVERGAPDITMECEPCFAGSPTTPSPPRTPPQMEQRWSQMMEESRRSPGLDQLSPFSSPEGSPERGTVTQTACTKRFITGVPPRQ